MAFKPKYVQTSAFRNDSASKILDIFSIDLSAFISRESLEPLSKQQWIKLIYEIFISVCAKVSTAPYLFVVDLLLFLTLVINIRGIILFLVKQFIINLFVLFSIYLITYLSSYQVSCIKVQNPILPLSLLLSQNQHCLCFVVYHYPERCFFKEIISHTKMKELC